MKKKNRLKKKQIYKKKNDNKAKGKRGKINKKNDKAMPEWGKRKRPIYPEEPDKGATGLTLEHHCE